MDTQLSRFYLAAHPLYRLMVQFRANGSHPRRAADCLRRGYARRILPVFRSGRRGKSCQSRWRLTLTLGPPSHGFTGNAVERL